MKIIKVVSIVLALILSLSDGIAQVGDNDTQVPRPKHFADNIFGIGLHASLVTGMGISFRQRIANTAVAYQINGGVLKFSSTYLYDIGGEFQFDLSGSDNDRVYLIAGLGYYYKGMSVNDLTTPIRIGAGGGYEFSMTKQIGLSLGVLIMAFLPGGNILPLPQIGMHFFFK